MLPVGRAALPGLSGAGAGTRPLSGEAGSCECSDLVVRFIDLCSVLKVILVVRECSCLGIRFIDLCSILKVILVVRECSNFVIRGVWVPY